MKQEQIQKIKEQRAKRLGQISKAGSRSTLVSRIEWQPSGKRKGRTRTAWQQEVQGDLERAGIRNWKEKTKATKLWRTIYKKI